MGQYGGVIAGIEACRKVESETCCVVDECVVPSEAEKAQPARGVPIMLVQADGHPTIRVFDTPEPGVPVANEIPSHSPALLYGQQLHSAGSYCNVSCGTVHGWVGAKHVQISDEVKATSSKPPKSVTWAACTQPPPRTSSGASYDAPDFPSTPSMARPNPSYGRGDVDGAVSPVRASSGYEVSVFPSARRSARADDKVKSSVRDDARAYLALQEEKLRIAHSRPPGAPAQSASAAAHDDAIWLALQKQCSQAPAPVACQSRLGSLQGKTLQQERLACREKRRGTHGDLADYVPTGINRLRAETDPGPMVLLSGMGSRKRPEMIQTDLPKKMNR